MNQYTYTDSDNQIYHYDIQCLKGTEVLSTKPLWEEVFSEDSQAFTDYYFSRKATKNITFVCKYLGTIVSMIHMTPYNMCVKGEIIPTFYIVGAATKEEHRHRGLMATLLQEVFTYAGEVKSPFVFLMPADPAIYEPFGFSYIYARPEYDVPISMLAPTVYISKKPKDGFCVKFINASISKSDLCKLASFANNTLSQQVDYYIFRTEDYFDTLLAELQSQHGGIYLFKKEEDIVGYILYANEGNPFIQEMVLSPDFDMLVDSIFMSTYIPSVQTEKKPIIMAKNICISESLEHIDYVNLLSNLKGCINEIV